MTDQCSNKQMDEHLAVNIIHQWKNDPVTRLEFGQNFSKYIDHRLGEDNKQRMN